jgi:quercetin dioxygenase-like cupin family protein
MRRTALFVSVAFVTSAATMMSARVQAQDTSSSSMGLPTGGKIHVMQGNPKAGPSTIRMTLPDGYVVALHRHPGDQTITVVSGTFVVTYGTMATTLASGQSTTIKANTLHTEQAQGPTVIEVQSAGPYGIVYAPKSSASPQAAKP